MYLRIKMYLLLKMYTLYYDYEVNYNYYGSINGSTNNYINIAFNIDRGFDE